jgi:hypothetical protein
MKKNIQFQRIPANGGLPPGWYKEPGLPVWYTKIFGIKFRITNAHEECPGAWFVNCNETVWVQMNELKPDFHTMHEHAALICETALQYARSYFTMCINNVDYNIEKITKCYQK